MLQLKDYQERSLGALREYFRLVLRHGAKTAFVLQTDRPYRSVPQMEGVPYVCLRVPTGGGKTLMACHALGTAAQEFLQAERTICMWLVPSNAICSQTLGALSDRRHPYRQAIDEVFGGNVRVLNLAEALYISRGDLDGPTCIIVTTLQALRVEDTEGRKVYETASALQHHFDGISPAMRATLEKHGDGAISYSLANALRMRRPVVIMDEAHNARTLLSFDTLARFNPSCIIEFTATPETVHEPDKERFASNIIHQVSARELKEAGMVKLPIKLRTRADWRETVGDAIQTQRMLEGLAGDELKETGEYIRPIVLLQAQAVHGEGITVGGLKQTLIADFKIPEDQIAIATGSTRELRDVDLFERSCPLRFIITVRALVEGWDCSFAYILCSVSEISTARSVEQVLGRILRLPQAKKKRREPLNCAYAFAASDRFVYTATSLKDALVEGAGFQRMEVGDLVISDMGNQVPIWGPGSLFAQASELVTKPPDVSGLESALRNRITYDSATGLLTVIGPVADHSKERLRQCFTLAEDRQAVERIFQRLDGRVLPEKHEGHIPTIRVPLLAIRVDGQLELFDESHFLDSPWSLADCDATLTETQFPREHTTGAEGEIDVTDSGHVEMIRFVAQLQEDLALPGTEPDWSTPALVNWIDRQIPHPDIPQHQSSLYIHRTLTWLMETRGLPFVLLARQRFRLARALEGKIESHRQSQRREAYQTILYGSTPTPLEVDPVLCLTYDNETYAPNWFYEGGFRFQKHLYGVIGELPSVGEEFECATFLDQMPEIELWVRNIERRPESSFWLQTSTDRFYPDFVARLTDGRILVVECKGEHLWSNDDSKEKRAIGDLWAERSGGRCLFVMPKGKDFGAILGAARRPAGISA